jgi:CubicO group peptidase (beta-lactamase class C family)
MTWKSLGLLVLVAFPFPNATAQQPGEVSYLDTSVMPTGVEGERIQSLIATFNSGDTDRVRRFLEEECTARFRGVVPMEEHFSVFSSFRRQTGGLEFHSIRTYVPERTGQTVVILMDRNYGGWRAFTVQFDASEARLIDSISFNNARTPSNVEEPSFTETQLVNETSEIVRRVCENDVFSGTVLLARGDEVLYSHACGEASKRFHVPNNIDTKFNLGSMNKMFTATAIAQLVEKGVLSYDETIAEYVDESWLPRETTEKITIAHLLSHTSGLGSYFNDTYWNGSRQLYREVDDFKPLVVGDELAFEPGERFRYSNTGMLILGVVIESATDGSYFDYIRENVYAPAGMTDSDSYDMDEPVENLAIGYDPDPESKYGWRNNYFMHVIRGGPAGGGFSAVGDLHRFALALLDRKLVSQASLDEMWKPQSDTDYGYGFGISEGPKGLVVGHSGGFSGINSNLSIFVDAGYIVAVMSNYSNGASPLADRIEALVEATQDGS